MFVLAFGRMVIDCPRTPLLTSRIVGDSETGCLRRQVAVKRAGRIWEWRIPDYSRTTVE